MSTNLYIQAREGSTRLHGKVLKKLCNKTIIQILFERMFKVKNIKKIILITGSEIKNKNIIEECKRIHLDYFCGNEINLLDRFYNASLYFPSENIIRITADNPFTDYDLINKGLKLFTKGDYDILSNNRIKTYPLGLNFEIFTTKALQLAWKNTLYNFKNTVFLKTEIPPTKYLLSDKNIKNYDFIHDKDLSKIALTIDTPQDFEMLSNIFESIYSNNHFFTLKDIMKYYNKIMLNNGGEKNEKSYYWR